MAQGAYASDGSLRVTISGTDGAGGSAGTPNGNLFNATVVAVPAGASTKVASAGDKLYSIINIDTGNINLGFGVPAVVDSGFPCDAAPGAGRQGGGFFLDIPTTTAVDIFAYSAAGSRVVVLKG